jgi:hypothetical protein
MCMYVTVSTLFVPVVCVCVCVCVCAAENSIAGLGEILSLTRLTDLETLHIAGNPVAQEPQLESTVLSTLPALRCLDEIVLRSPTRSSSTVFADGMYTMLCIGWLFYQSSVCACAQGLALPCANHSGVIAPFVWHYRKRVCIVCLCMYVCMYVCMHCVFMCVCSACMHVMHVCMHVCMHVYVATRAGSDTDAPVLRSSSRQRTKHRADRSISPSYALPTYHPPLLTYSGNETSASGDDADLESLATKRGRSMCVLYMRSAFTVL